MKKITLLFVLFLTIGMANVSKISAQTVLGTPIIGATTAISAYGFTANWTPVTNASSYSMIVYQSDGVTVVSTTPVAGSTTSTFTVGSLTPLTSYKFTVIAVGDGVTYTNSLESAQTAVTTISSTLAVPTLLSPSGVTTSTLTANWAAVIGASSYDVRIYDATQTLVGTAHNVSGQASVSLAISGLTLARNASYSYSVKAIGDGVSYFDSPESSKSISFYIQSADSKVVYQYAVADVNILSTDIKSAAGAAGSADIYELTTSGGAYTFTATASNNNAMIKNTFVRAASGLANKPILKIGGAAITASNPCMFYSITPGLTIKFDGLEFDGIAINGAVTQPEILYCTTTATDNKVYFSNCKAHDFLNASGNGAVRMDGVSTAGVLDIQGSTFNNCSGRMFYINEASGTTTINMKNCTFSNNQTQNARANIVYNTAANGGTQTYDHCTFYNILVSTTSPIYIKAVGGVVTIKNCIFSNVGLTQPVSSTTIISNCYVAGFATPPTTTSPFTTAPIYANAATLDFTLTNKSSFICPDASIAGNTMYYPVLPKLTSPTVGTASNVLSNSFTANWTAVANASGGYDVKVYQGATLIGTTPVAGQSTQSVAVAGLKTGTTYTYTVVAKGDAINWDLSDPSAASASFTTLGLSVPVVGTSSNITSSGFTANWTPVANALSYDVKVYLTAVLVSTTNVSGQSSSSLPITGLAMGTTYTYTVTAIGNGGLNSNSDPSANSSITKTLPTTVSVINPVFEDGTWGTVTPSSPALGTYPVFSANGWDLTHAQVKTNNTTGPKGEVHPAVLMMDKTTNSGVIYSPTVAAVEEIEIHSSATAGRQYYLEVTTDGGITYRPVGPGNSSVPTAGTYYNINANLEQIDVIPTGSLTNAKFRITDPSSGAYTFYQIKTRLTHPTNLTAPTVGTISDVTATTAVAHWTPADANASGYEVKVYKGTVIKFIGTVTGQASSLAVTGLQGDSTYTYKVKALGDDITYSDSYQSAVSAAFTMAHQCAIPLVGNVSAITSSGFTANWTAVANATGYDVKVYNAALSLISTTNASGQSSTSLDISGLNQNTPYTFTVTAKGDATYADSYPSAATSFTTLLGTGMNKTEIGLSMYVENNVIYCSEIGNIDVYTLHGAKLLQASNVSKLNADLKNGLYIVRFTGINGQIISKKLIIK
jgi:hypothetical protein